LLELFTSTIDEDEMTKEYKLLISINFPLISLDNKIIANALIGDVYEALGKYKLDVSSVEWIDYD
jgi:hypothetical protein